MVLAELGSSISNAIQGLTRASVIDETALNQMLNGITKALLAADVEFPLVVKLQKNIKAKINLDEAAANVNLRKTIHQTVVQELYNLLDSGSKPYELKKGKTNVIMFVGLQGSGKTTTVTKFAHYYQRKGWKTGLVCADTYRAGAFDQLKQNATKAKIPFYGSYTEVDPVVVAEAGVSKFRKDRYDLIIIDTSGRHKQESALFEEMQEVARVCKPDDIVFVMDGSIGKSAKDQALAFRSAVDVGSVIITKLDGHAKGGGALSAVAATQSPIIFIGTGEHITDIEAFNTRSFVSRLLGMGDIGGLISLVQDTDIMESQQQLYKKLAEGKGGFSLRDMHDQFKNILKLGPMSQIMSMLPLGNIQMGPGHEKEAVGRIKKCMTMLDSMTPKELDGDGKIFNTQPTRTTRVARGAGVDEEEVKGLFQMYKPFSQMGNMIGGMAKGGMDMNKMQQMQQQMMKGGKVDPRMAKQMQGMMDPKMMQNMMQQMTGGMGGGLGDMMNSLMGSMGGMGGMPGMGGMGGGKGGAGGMPPGMAEMMKKMGMGGK